MSHNQSAALEKPRALDVTTNHEAHNVDLSKAITSGELTLSLSTMLGCDYIFVSHKGMHELLRSTHIHKTIRELLDLLETSPHQSMVISADEAVDNDPTFIRYDFAWENRQVTKVSITPVTQHDQIDFMRMMFDCSTPY